MFLLSVPNRSYVELAIKLKVSNFKMSKQRKQIKIEHTALDISFFFRRNWWMQCINDV